MYDKEHADLALYRLSRAEEALTDAQDALAQEKYTNAANRSYYAFFHAARAVLALEAKDFKKHSGVIGYFQKEYVKTGIFEIQMGKNLQGAFHLRTKSDYQDFYVISKEKVTDQVDNAKTFVEAVKSYLLRQM